MRFFLSRTLPVLIIMLLGSQASAQYQDFRSWWNAEVSKELIKDLDVKVELSQRFKENSTAYDRSVITASVKYELFKDFTVRGGYRYLILQDNGLFESRYRIHAGAQYGKDIESFSVSLRQRIQYGFDDLQSMNVFQMQKTVSRTRLKASYDIFGTPLKAHAFYELFIDLNTGSGVMPEANRYSLGLEYSFLKKGSLDISYMLEQEVNAINPLISHILLVTYAYEL